jgi:hypothetical protein
MVPGTVLGGITATIGGLTLGAVDGAGVAWTIDADGLQGWDSPEIRATLTDREADHGSWWTPVYYSSRPITLTGTITAPSQAALDAAIDTLLGSVPHTDTVLAVYETQPKQATVRRSGKPLVKRVTDRIATYSLMVTAQDPRRYDVNEQTAQTGLPTVTGGLAAPVTAPLTVGATVTAGQIFAANGGTFETRPVLSVYGPATRPSISVQYSDGSTDVLSYSDTLQSGDVLVLDCGARTAVLNGTASRRRYLSGSWPLIPAMDSVVLSFRASVYTASAALVAAWRSAWI